MCVNDSRVASAAARFSRRSIAICWTASIGPTRLPGIRTNRWAFRCNARCS